MTEAGSRFEVVERHDGRWVVDRDTGRRVRLADDKLPRGYAGCIDPSSPTYCHQVQRVLNRYPDDTLDAFFAPSPQSKSV
jgi:hypothetical protein